jgi:hypothetical protein
MPRSTADWSAGAAALPFSSVSIIVQDMTSRGAAERHRRQGIDGAQRGDERPHGQVDGARQLESVGAEQRVSR